MMKKVLSLALVAALMAACAVPAFAHGGRHGRRVPYYAVCSVENCDQTGTHRHGNGFYQAHHSNDGHSYHDQCTVSGCTQTGYHAHDASYHCGSNGDLTPRGHCAGRYAQ